MSKCKNKEPEWFLKRHNFGECQRRLRMLDALIEVKNHHCSNATELGQYKRARLVLKDRIVRLGGDIQDDGTVSFEPMTAIKMVVDGDFRQRLLVA